MAVPVLRSTSTPAPESARSDDDNRRHPLRVDLDEGLVVVEHQLWIVPQGPDPIDALLSTYVHAVRAGRGTRKLKVLRDEDLRVLAEATGTDVEALVARMRRLG